MLNRPFSELGPYPKRVATKGDDGQEQPHEPASEQLHGAASEHKPAPLNNCVLGLPAKPKYVSEREAKTQSKHSDEGAE